MKAAIGMGSSLGDRYAWLELAVRCLNAHPDISVVRTSRWVRTPPMRGGTARGWFLNGVVLVETSLDPRELLEVCRELEDRAARRRKGHWGDRTLDLDILHVENVEIRDAWLVLPHPGLADRPFALAPLQEVWPEARNPGDNRLFTDYPVPQKRRPVAVGILPRRLTDTV